MIWETEKKSLSAARKSNTAQTSLTYIDIVGTYFEFSVLFLVAEYPCAEKEMLVLLLPKNAFLLPD